MLSVVSVKAQTSRISMNIPFDFTVGQRTFPAGTYTLEPARSDSRTVWLLKSEAGKDRLVFITNSAWTKENIPQNRLVFNQYGDRHILSQIWNAGENSGRELTQPKWLNDLVKNGAKPQYVVIKTN